MKKIIPVLLANVLVFALVIALSTGAYAMNVNPDPNLSLSLSGGESISVPDPGGPPVAEEEETTGGWLELPFILNVEMLDDGSLVYSAERYLNPAEYGSGETVYEPGSWLLDQIGVKLDATDGDARNVRLVLAAVEGISEKLKLILPTDGELSFPSEDKSLILEMKDYGTVTIPAAAAGYSITEILISVADDTVNFEAYSDGTVIAGLGAEFEPAEGTAYTMTQPEPEAEAETETEAAE